MRLRPIDLHAHVASSISGADLSALNALVFVATRTLDEAETALRRADQWTIWGVGCHPGLVGAQKSFNATRFESLIELSPYVAELGLDGRSRVPIDRQLATLMAVLDILQRKPRITSLHSSGATTEVLNALERNPIKGAVLHWWLGDEGETARAVHLGCYFSINAAMLDREDVLRGIPVERALTETDHPFGDRFTGRSARPGGVGSVEAKLAQQHGVTADAIRAQVWRNLAAIVGATRTGALLERPVRIALAAA